MILLFTDFGLTGPYLGQVRAVLAERAPQTPVIDLFADAPVYDPKASSYLLAAYSQGFPEGTVFLAVVDPGVGTETRDPVIVKADGRWYVGPDNGLFNVVAARAKEVQAWHLLWRPKTLSASFHGRDLFAPIAGDIACGRLPSAEDLKPVPLQSRGEDLFEVIYVDHFGNLISGVRGDSLNPGDTICIDNCCPSRARTFGDVKPGQPLCYANANGMIEVAVNQGRASDYFKANVGTPLRLNRKVV